MFFQTGAHLFNTLKKHGNNSMPGLLSSFFFNGRLKDRDGRLMWRPTWSLQKPADGNSMLGWAIECSIDIRRHIPLDIYDRRRAARCGATPTVPNE
jgi:hypothetical protein